MTETRNQPVEQAPTVTPAQYAGALTDSGGAVATPIVELRADEADFLEREKEALVQARKAERQRKDARLAVVESWSALRSIPSITAKSARLGVEAAALTWEQPSRTFAAARAILNAAQEGAEFAWDERGTLSGPLLTHAQKTIQEAIEVQDRAPDSVSTAVTKAGAAASDVTQGVVEPSIKKLGAGTVEGTQSAGSVASAVMEEPGHALGTVKEAITAGVISATLPFRSPIKTIKAAWSSTKAAGSMAGLTAAAPSQVASAFNAVTAAAREVGTAGGSTLAAVKRAPGGTVGQGLVVVLLLPAILTAALAGASFGLGWELAGRTLSLIASFMASCLAAAAHVVAWRFPATIQPYTAGVDTLSGGRTGSAAGEHHLDHLTERADSLTLTAARDALLTVRARLEQEAAVKQRKPTLKAVSSALSAAGRSTKRALSKLAFWRRRGRAASSSQASSSLAGSGTATPAYSPDASSAVSAHAISVPEHLGLEPASPDVPAAGPTKLDTMSSSTISSSSSGSSGGQPIQTPAGLLLPMLALGLADGPYAISTSTLYSKTGETPVSKSPEPELEPDFQRVSGVTSAATGMSAATANQQAAAAAAAQAALMAAAQQGYAGDVGMMQQRLDTAVDQQQEHKLDRSHSFKRGTVDESAAEAVADSVRQAAALEPASIPASPALASWQASTSPFATLPGSQFHHPVATVPLPPVKQVSKVSKVQQWAGWLWYLLLTPVRWMRYGVEAIVDMVASTRALLQLLFSTLLITFTAALDSVLAVSKVASSTGPGDTLGLRLHRVGSLLLQPVVLASAASMAAADTAVWRFKKAVAVPRSPGYA